MRPAQPAALHQRFTPAPLALAAAMTIALAAGHVPLAHAQSGAATAAATPIAINISAQPLGQALNELARQANLQMTFPAALVEGKRAPAVSGQLTVQQALDRLLAGSGLVASVDGASVMVRSTSQAAQSSEATLPAVTVTADGEKENAWGAVKGYVAKRSATGTKTDTPILETPASVQVITRDVIDDQKAVNLRDVYENMSGVQQAGNTLNAQTEVLPIIRGFESPSLMRNGLRATEAGAVDLANVERVEVLKGPASILYGALEPGGILNYVTKRPQAESSHTIEQQFGSYDYRRTSLDSTGALNKSATLMYRLNLAQTDSDSFREGMHLSRTSIAPSILWRPTDDTELLVDFSYLKEKQPYDSGIPLFANGKPRVSERTTFLASNLSGRENEDFYAGYQLSHTVNSTWSVRNQLQYHKAHNRNESLRHRGIQGNNLRLRYQNEDRLDDEVQFVLDGTAKFKTGTVDHTFLLGAEYISQDSDFESFRTNIPDVAIVNDPVVNFVPPINQNPGRDISKTEWHSVYLQDQMSLLDGGRLKLLIGGRFDDVVTTGKSDGVSAQEVKDRAFTGRAGVLYMLSSQHSVYLSASQSFRPQYAYAVDVAGTPLDPETGQQYELGLKSAFFNERLMTTVALYNIEKENVAVFDQALFNATGQSAYFPGVKQRSRGVEIDASGKLTNQLKLVASYAYTDTEVLQNKGDPAQVGNPLGGVSPHSARLWLTYDFVKTGPLSGFGLGGGARYVGRSTTQFDTSIKLDSYTVADAAVWYNWKNVRVSLNVKNLFNKDYIVRGSHDAIAHPGAPRSVFASVSVGF